MSNDELLALAREWFDYEPESGNFRWKKRPGSRSRVSAGGIVGTLTYEGYRQIRVQGNDIKAHRLAWLIVHGAMPAGHLDHINGRKDDNRIANLRVVTDTENVHSVFRPSRNSRTGIRGVSPYRGGFQAKITAEKKTVYLGTFATVEEAQAAYLAAKSSLHPASVVSRPFLIEGVAP